MTRLFVPMPRLFVLLLIVALCSAAMQVRAEGTSPGPADAPTGPASQPAAPTVATLMQRQLQGNGAKAVQMLTVQYPPGGASKPHQHHAEVFVYVLSGKLRMQVKGGPLLTLGPGETFYEGPDDVHVVSANASATQPAKFLVFLIQDKAAQDANQQGAR